MTTREARRQRFGHIDLPFAVPHPLGAARERLSAVPVLPAAFWQAPAGRGLAEVYENLVRAVGSGDSHEPTEEPVEETISRALNRLIQLLLPVVTFAQEWNLAEAPTIARGLALERCEELA